MSDIKVGIIGGTGVYNQSLFSDSDQITVDTAYGAVAMMKCNYKERMVYFLARHGGGHSVPPHKINYKANIAALKQVGADKIIATAAVGSLNKAMPPGSMVVIDQFIDLTRQRPLTFFEGDNGLVVHTDFTEPYCSEIRQAILKAGQNSNQKLLEGGCYVCTEGPRFESPAEIKMMKQWGGDLVGMTNIPEAVLAREAGLCYATIALSTNYAAGISAKPLTHQEVLDIMDRVKPGLDRLLTACLENIKPEHSCSCSKTGQYWKERS
ncbi:MAG: S-methyl-5'-thioadenosine phosphorylase [Bacillota bacterium]